MAGFGKTVNVVVRMSGTPGQIGFYDGANELNGDPDFRYDRATRTLYVPNISGPGGGPLSAPSGELVYGTGSGVTSSPNATFDSATKKLTLADGILVLGSTPFTFSESSPGTLLCDAANMRVGAADFSASLGFVGGVIYGNVAAGTNVWNIAGVDTGAGGVTMALGTLDPINEGVVGIASNTSGVLAGGGLFLNNGPRCYIDGTGNGYVTPTAALEVLAGSTDPGIFGKATSGISGVFQTVKTDGSNSNPTLVAKLNTAQTANLFEAQDASGVALSFIAADGAFNGNVVATAAAQTISGRQVVLASDVPLELATVGTLTATGEALFACGPSSAWSSGVLIHSETNFGFVSLSAESEDLGVTSGAWVTLDSSLLALFPGQSGPAAGNAIVDLGIAVTNPFRSAYLSSFVSQSEIATPTAPADGSLRIYAKDAGGGKTGLYVLFPSGAEQQIKVEA